jgi:hypothetical protein
MRRPTLVLLLIVLSSGGGKAAAEQAYGSFTHVEPFAKLNR